jgi:hypothetical protein
VVTQGRLDDERILVAPVMTVAGKQTYALVLALNDQAIGKAISLRPRIALCSYSCAATSQPFLLYQLSAGDTMALSSNWHMSRSEAVAECQGIVVEGADRRTRIVRKRAKTLCLFSPMKARPIAAAFASATEMINIDKPRSGKTTQIPYMIEWMRYRVNE